MDIDMRITLQKLEVLSLVVQLGGIGRAAEHLYVSQPVVSAHIRSLDERLGVKLFYREGRQLQLTEAGQVVHEWAEDLLMRTRELDRHLSGLSDGQRGTVHLAASMTLGSYVLPGLLASFRKEYPSTDLSLAVTDTEHAVEDTRTGRYDFAVVVSHPTPDFPGLDVRHVGSDEIVLVAAPGLLEESRLAPEDLATLPFVEAEGFIRRTYVSDRLAELGVGRREIAIQLGHPEAMKRAVEQGLGVSMMFRSAVTADLDAGRLVQIQVDGLSLCVPIVVVSRKGKTFSPLHVGLIERIGQALGSASDEHGD